jgi:hypothetical protein
VPETDGVSVGVGSRQIVLFCYFEGPRREFGARLPMFHLVAGFFSLSEFLQSTFCKLNSLFSLLFQQEDLDLIQAWHTADV